MTGRFCLGFGPACHTPCSPWGSTREIIALIGASRHSRDVSLLERLSCFLSASDRNSRAPARSACIPPGQRVYAIGDVHGCADLLLSLIGKIEADAKGRECANTTLIFLGDLIDRGPDSARVMEIVEDLRSRWHVRMIAGNHEEMFLASFNSDRVLRQFLQHGGRETILSYMDDHAAYTRLTIEELRERLPSLVPARHLRLMETMESMIQIGDYLFVHAGIRPGIALADQSDKDLRWIREEFLEANWDPGVVVVHGHTVSREVISAPHRVGIDTGAYVHGRLTAIALEANVRWFLYAGT